MEKLEKVKSELKDLSEDGAYYTISEIERIARDTLDVLQKQQETIERLKDELNQYHKADTFLAVHGWKWKDYGTEHHTEQLKDGEQE